MVGTETILGPRAEAAKAERRLRQRERELKEEGEKVRLEGKEGFLRAGRLLEEEEIGVVHGVVAAMNVCVYVYMVGEAQSATSKLGCGDEVLVLSLCYHFISALT